MPQRYDMHCHLDFSDNCKEIAKKAIGHVCAVNATVTPSEFVSSREKLGGFESIHLALGLHPWWIASGKILEADINRFERLLPECNLVGEIGLDFHGERRESRDAQLAAFERMLSAIAKSSEPKLVFLHSVKATQDVIKLIEESGALDGSKFVFHWFQGSQADLERAIADGFAFSVGRRMLSSRKGAAFAASIPVERLLVETDSPAHPGMSWSCEEWLLELDSATEALCEIKEMEYVEMLDATNANAAQLLREYV